MVRLNPTNAPPSMSPQLQMSFKSPPPWDIILFFFPSVPGPARHLRYLPLLPNVTTTDFNPNPQTFLRELWCDVEHATHLPVRPPGAVPPFSLETTFALPHSVNQYAVYSCVSPSKSPSLGALHSLKMLKLSQIVET